MSKNHRNNWLKSLLNQNLKPQIELIDEGYKARSSLCDAEVFLIAFYRELGVDLVNGTDGGDGGNGPRTEEWKKNHSLMMKGKKKPPRTEEHRKNLSLGGKGKHSRSIATIYRRTS